MKKNIGLSGNEWNAILLTRFSKEQTKLLEDQKKVKQSWENKQDHMEVIENLFKDITSIWPELKKDDEIIKLYLKIRPENEARQWRESQARCDVAETSEKLLRISVKMQEAKEANNRLLHAFYEWRNDQISLNNKDKKLSLLLKNLNETHFLWEDAIKKNERATGDAITREELLSHRQ